MKIMIHEQQESDFAFIDAWKRSRSDIAGGVTPREIATAIAGSVRAQHHTARYRWGGAPAGESYSRFAFGTEHRADTPGAKTDRSAGARQMLLAGDEGGPKLEPF